MNIFKYIVFTLLVSSWPLSAQLNIDDFRGAEWGQSMDDISFTHQENPEWIREGKTGQYTIYSIADEDKTIGSARLNHIHYHFDKSGDLSRVVFSGSDEYNEDIESVLNARLGPPSNMQLYEWEVLRIWEDSNIVVIFREHRDMEFVVELNSKQTVKEMEELNKSITDF